MNDQIQRDFYRLSPTDVLDQLHTQETGLQSSEAKNRLAQFGNNALSAKRREPWLVTYLRQFKDLMIVLLVASGALS